MWHLSPLANCDDKKDEVISDLEHRDERKAATKSQPTSCRSQERVSRHRSVPGHLLVVRVLQENLTKMFSKQFSCDVEQQKRFSHPDNKKVVFGISYNSVFKIMFSFFDIFAHSGSWWVESILPFLKLAVILLAQNGIWVMGIHTLYSERMTVYTFNDAAAKLSPIWQWCVMLIVFLKRPLPVFVVANIPQLWDDQAEVFSEWQGSLFRVATPRCNHPQLLAVTVLGCKDEKCQQLCEA